MINNAVYDKLIIKHLKQEVLSLRQIVASSSIEKNRWVQEKLRDADMCRLEVEKIEKQFYPGTEAGKVGLG